MRRYVISLVSLTAAVSLSAAPALAPATIVSSSPYASSSWFLSAQPTFDLPLFAGDGAADPVFSSAWGARVDARHALVGPLSARASFGWSMAGIEPVSGLAVSGSLSELSLLAGADLGKKLSSAFAVDAFLDAGGAYGSMSTGATGFYPSFRAGAGLDLSFGGGLGTRLETSFDYKGGLYAGLGLSLGLVWNPPLPKASKDEGIRLLEFGSVESSSIFPILRSYYEGHPFGKVVLTNKAKNAAEDVHVALMVKNYMDAPKECAVIPSIAPGASVEVPLSGLFNEELLKVTEPTKVAAELKVSVGGTAGSSTTATLTIQDRTALTWDDDRKAAAFVSSKDPWVLDLVGNINAIIKDSRSGEVPKNLQSAMAVHEGLRAYGIGYLLSPSRPFAQEKVDVAVVDNLKFPRQTLSYRSGDCADLSVLYASCLEAMGIETAFITIPGHIFMAVDLGIVPSDAAAKGIEESQLIVQDDRAWVPIETTIRDKDFSEVWQTAAKEWRDSSAKGVAAFYPLHDAWNTYAPVGLPADGSSVSLPAKSAVLPLFSAELDKIVQAQLSLRIAALGPIPAKGAPAKLLNARGILYGRYGLLPEAERDFQAAAKDSYTPALVNLGNVAFLRGDFDTAYRAYRQASVSAPKDPKLLANIAKAAAALGRSDEASSALAALDKIDPEAASRYSGLAQQGGSGGARAAEVGGGSVDWF